MSQEVFSTLKDRTSEDQRIAKRLIINNLIKNEKNDMFLLKGFAGTGKTHVAAEICEICDSNASHDLWSFVCAAPTNDASDVIHRRISDAVLTERELDQQHSNRRAHWDRSWAKVERYTLSQLLNYRADYSTGSVNFSCKKGWDYFPKIQWSRRHRTVSNFSQNGKQQKQQEVYYIVRNKMSALFIIDEISMINEDYWINLLEFRESLKIRQKENIEACENAKILLKQWRKFKDKNKKSLTFLDFSTSKRAKKRRELSNLLFRSDCWKSHPLSLRKGLDSKEAEIICEDISRLSVTELEKSVKFLLLGDPSQLPPIGEKRISLAFDEDKKIFVENKTSFTLKKIVRTGDPFIMKMSSIARQFTLDYDVRKFKNDFYTTLKLQRENLTSNQGENPMILRRLKIPDLFLKKLDHNEDFNGSIITYTNESSKIMNNCIKKKLRMKNEMKKCHPSCRDCEDPECAAYKGFLKNEQFLFQKPWLRKDEDFDDGGAELQYFYNSERAIMTKNPERIHNFFPSFIKKNSTHVSNFSAVSVSFRGLTGRNKGKDILLTNVDDLMFKKILKDEKDLIKDKKREAKKVYQKIVNEFKKKRPSRANEYLPSPEFSELMNETKKKVIDQFGNLADGFLLACKLKYKKLPGSEYIKAGMKYVFKASNISFETQLQEALSTFNSIFVNELLKIVCMIETEYCPELRDVYSKTAHKSQGQTIDIVYLDIPEMLNRRKQYDFNDEVHYFEIARLIYTGITRAEREIYFNIQDMCVGHNCNPGLNKIPYGEFVYNSFKEPVTLRVNQLTNENHKKYIEEVLCKHVKMMDEYEKEKNDRNLETREEWAEFNEEFSKSAGIKTSFFYKIKKNIDDIRSYVKSYEDWKNGMICECAYLFS